MPDVSIGQRLDWVFARYAGRRALKCGARHLDYAALDVQSGAVAAHLLALDLPVGSTLAFDVERSIEQVVLIVGIVRAGLSFCFLDSTHPAEWNQSVMARIGIRYLISREPADEGPVRGLELAALLKPGVAGAPLPQLEGGEPVYVNFSSGTTGAPKIIPCTHRGVLGFCQAPRHFPLPAQFTLLYASNLTFDASQFELWTALLNGGTVQILASPWLSSAELERLIKQEQVDTLWLTSTLFNTLVDIDPGMLAGVQRLMVGGEVLSPQHVRAAYYAVPDLQIYNGYGPTENTMGTCVYAIPRDMDGQAEIPIGYAVEDAQLHVLRADGSPCAAQECGELVIAGAGLSPGYIGDEALTAQKFTWLWLQGRRVRCYRSGDRVSRSAQGLFRFHGRNDDQVKIRGHRLTLTEVSASFKQCPGILDCSAWVEERGGQSHLVLAYLASVDLPATQVQAYGHQRLPAYMVPDHCVRLDTFPLRASGKLDVAALKAQLGAPPLPAPEAGLGALLAPFGVVDLDLTRSFFDSGANSLGAIKLVALLNRLAGKEFISLAQFHQLPTLSDLAARLAEHPDLAGLLKAGRERYYVIALEQGADHG